MQLARREGSGSEASWKTATGAFRDGTWASRGLGQLLYSWTLWTPADVAGHTSSLFEERETDRQTDTETRETETK